MKHAQSCVTLTSADIFVPGTPAPAPCEVTAPVAAVSRSVPATLPVAYPMLDALPVEPEVTVNAPDTLSKVTVLPSAVDMSVPIALKLEPEARLTVPAASTPSTSTCSGPFTACSAERPIAATLPPRSEEHTSE